ncbi:MAG: hypothetical protein HYU80_01790 [Candidatus Blackburnbacteria bacterium]|nr:hypothetical protein [Candidatus Blackburnbacteria bacterium]
MSFFGTLVHLFIPHSSNNHRAKFLHPFFVGIFISVFVGSQLLASFLPFFAPIVLGYSSKITPEKIVELTNQERTKSGRKVLQMDDDLNRAALLKAADMFARDYWAHNSPDGQEPWHFFIEADYQYKYAGENLARDFTKDEDVVLAWIASPSHKENLLSSRYEDMGIAVVEGELGGIKTTLVVQLFGTRINLAAVLPRVEAQTEKSSVVPYLNLGSEQVAGKIVSISPFSIKKSLAIFLISVFVFIFVLDILLISRNNVQRRSSRSFAHLSFLVVILAIVLLSRSGVIM